MVDEKELKGPRPEIESSCLTHQKSRRERVESVISGNTGTEEVYVHINNTPGEVSK